MLDRGASSWIVECELLAYMETGVRGVRVVMSRGL